MTDAKTHISVIVATFNRAASLRECLQSLVDLANDGTFTYEVIVADNNSTDSTKEVVNSFKTTLGDRLQYVFEPRQGKTYALNQAIGVARGSILCFTDDDVTVDPQWLVAINRCFREQGCDGLGGRILPTYPSSTPAWVKENLDILMGTVVFYDYGEDVKKYQKPMIEFLGANYAFRKSVFDECGLFRTDLGVGTGYLGEDTEFVNRLEAKQKQLCYCGRALVWHPLDLKRTEMKYIANWNIALGRYRVLMEKNKESNLRLANYFGVPRYLVRIMFKTLLEMFFKSSNKRESLKCWIKFNQDRGRAREYRRLYYASDE